jgi:2-keto-4-pentenoate hydratase/2-oxohepta-3-ene-1,7-dioic acid hydratase in catechol pathway
MLLFIESTPMNLIETVINMDEHAKNIYNKTAEILLNKQNYLYYLRAEKRAYDQKAQIKYGREEGREERELEMAIELKKEGIPTETIVKTTGLPYSKIKEL